MCVCGGRRNPGGDREQAVNTKLLLSGMLVHDILNRRSSIMVIETVTSKAIKLTRKKRKYDLLG